jgi:hypothetical protein
VNNIDYLREDLARILDKSSSLSCEFLSAVLELNIMRREFKVSMGSNFDGFLTIGYKEVYK